MTQQTNRDMDTLHLFDLQHPGHAKDCEKGHCILCGLTERACLGHRRDVLAVARKLYDRTHPNTQPTLF